MKARTEPVIVRLDPAHATRAALADVLIAGWDGRPDVEVFADLFRRYPGLTLVLVLHPTGIVAAGFRDHAVVTVCLDGALRAVAGLLFAGWVGTAKGAEPAADG